MGSEPNGSDPDSFCAERCRTHEWVGGKPPTHSWSLGFVKCAPPAPRPLPLAIPLERFRPAPADANAVRLSSAVALSVLRSAGASLLQLLHVRIELRLVLCRERRPDLGTLALH